MALSLITTSLSQNIFLEPLVQLLLARNSIVVDLVGIHKLKLNNLESDVAIWNNITKVPTRHQPRSGRNITILVHDTKFLALHSSGDIKRLSKSYKAVHVLVIETSLNGPVISSKYIFHARIVTLGFSKENETGVVGRLKCSMEKNFRLQQFWSSKGANENWIKLVADPCFKDPNRNLILDSYVIGSKPSVIRKSKVNPSGYRVEFMKIIGKRMGFTNNWILANNYNQVIKDV